MNGRLEEPDEIIQQMETSMEDVNEDLYLLRSALYG